MQADRLLSPSTYSYNCTYLGKEINPVVLNKKWQEYMSEMYKKQLAEACRATHCIAVRSTLLTRTQKEQYKDRRYHTERQVYYMFPADAVPLQVYIKLERKEGQLVYE